MTKKQKKMLYRIIAALALVLVLKLLPPLPVSVELLLYCIPYLVVGWDVLRKALLGIKNRQPFDECFLMAVATVGAFALGDYVEGCAVIIFYQIGELFQGVAVGKSRRSISALMDIRPDYANIEGEDGKSRWTPMKSRSAPSSWSSPASVCRSTASSSRALPPSTPPPSPARACPGMSSPAMRSSAAVST